MLKSFYKFLCLYPPRDFKLPVFSIVSAEKDRLATIGVEWDKFSQEAYICCSNPNFSYRKIGDFVWVEISGERINPYRFPPVSKERKCKCWTYPFRAFLFDTNMSKEWWQ